MSDVEALRETIARAISRGLWPEDSWDDEATPGDLRQDDREECYRAADVVIDALKPLLAAERERGRVDGLREAHRQILGLLGAPAPAGLAEPAPGEEIDRD